MNATEPPKSYIDELIDSATTIMESQDQDRDMSLAVALLTEAVRAGNTTAMRKLASLLLNGDEGIPADPGQAEALLKQAVAGGETNWGAVELGDLYMADTPLRNAGNAAAAYQTAVDAGNTGAMRKLAAIFRHGTDGVAPDPARAETLLSQAVAGGDVNWAALELGDLYQEDTPVRNPAKAAQAYDVAAQNGNVRAMLALAALLSHDGDLRNLNKARDLLVAALDGGEIKEAASRLGDLYLMSAFADRNVDDARSYFERAAEAGNTDAHLAILRLAALDIAKSTLDSATEHARDAARFAGRNEILNELMNLPSTSLVALVQSNLIEAGQVAEIDGRFGKQTAAAMMKYCDDRSISGCDARLVTRDFVAALVFGGN